MKKKHPPQSAASAKNQPPSRQIETHNEVADFHPSKKSVARLFGLLDSYPAHHIPPGELSIVFLDDAGISRLHEQFLETPETTDVITFPGDDVEPETGSLNVKKSEENFDKKNVNMSGKIVIETDDEPPPKFAGEICVCVPQARREAEKHGNSVQNEILLYLIHGWLHLAGLDDHSDADIAEMRSAEKHLLSWLSKHSFTPAWSA